MSIITRFTRWWHRFWDVPVIWRSAQTSLWAIAWDGFVPFSRPTMVGSVLYPRRPLMLHRVWHHVLQHMLPSAATTVALTLLLHTPLWLGALVGTVAFGLVPHFIGVYITRSYALDPRDWVADLWASAVSFCAVFASWFVVLAVAVWAVGYIDYNTKWASP